MTAYRFSVFVMAVAFGIIIYSCFQYKKMSKKLRIFLVSICVIIGIGAFMAAIYFRMLRFLESWL